MTWGFILRAAKPYNVYVYKDRDEYLRDEYVKKTKSEWIGRMVYGNAI